MCEEKQMNKNRAYRSSQLISPYGPGSIIEIGDESLVLADPSCWPKNTLKEIKLERLTKEAGVCALKKPPTVSGGYSKVKKSNSLMTVRFPEWVFCSRCRKMKQCSTETSCNADGVPVCDNLKCNKKVLVPMRFVAACEHGHLQDVPWIWWAHKNANSGICEHPDLYFCVDANRGSGLDALKVCCKNPDCNEYNTLNDLLQTNILGNVCGDRQPWEYPKKKEERHCSSIPQVLQRGASNVYYPIVRSALDIPYESKSSGNAVYQKIKDCDDFTDLINAIAANKEKRIRNYAEDIAEEYDLTVKQVLEAAKSEEQESRQFKIPDDEELRLAEWHILSSPIVEQTNTPNFKVRTANWETKLTFGFERILTRVLLLDKLREVRAFCGFERIKPGENSVVPNTAMNGRASWLPATEVFGEGIFLQFQQDQIDAWVKNLSQDFSSRLKDFEMRQSRANSNYLPLPTPKFLLLHTLSHLLIRQLSFESGYSSGSLRERIYAKGDQAGILIYTADGDSEGSLGGLVQQGEAERLFPALIAALETAHWCSNDPVCSEMEAQGVMGLNKAACHSCSLISETSCEHNNLLLDRKLLIGDVNNQGFFSSLFEILERDF